jgi:hypothetical protein
MLPFFKAPNDEWNAEDAATPKEAIGFWGVMTGTVKSAQADGTSFVLTVSKAEPDETKSAVKDGTAMVGKDLTLGTRMPRKDGKPYPSPEDVAFIKSLKPGMTVTVKIFAVHSDTKTLRLQAPGEIVAPKEKPKADAGR